jgi:predicted RNase H-like HicB family nuclease
MMTYTILAERDETGMWVGTCEQIDGFVTQARRLDQLRRNAREAASVALDINEDEITIVLAAVYNDDVIAVRQARLQANNADKHASELTTTVARRLHDEGLPLRDIAELVGISFQRVHQLIG